jgi:RNA polymerase sigma-70 factor (family 1)
LEPITPYTTDQALFNRIAAADEKAFRLLFDRYHRELFGVALKLTKSPSQAEEIVQELFISIWVSRLLLTAVDKPDAYIYRILYNHIKNYLRKESNRDRILRDALQFRIGSVNATEEAVDAHESEKRIEQALQLLPDRQKAVYRLNRQQGLSIDQIAEQLNISPHTVKSHLAKALEFMRTYLKDVTMVAGVLATFRDNTPF